MPKSSYVPGAAGNRIHLVDWGGEGPPLLLLHGMAGHTHWWDTAAPILARRHRTIAMDFRGHGDSQWLDDPQYELNDHAADIESVRDALGWDRFYLVAHSMGARVAIRYTNLYQKRVERLALLDFLTSVRTKTAPSERRVEGALPRDSARSRERYAKRMDRRQPTYSSCDGMVERYHLQPRGTTISDESLRSLGERSVTRLDNGRWTWKFDWRGFFMDYEPVWDEMSTIEAPCLIMRGEHSTVMPRPEFEKALAAVREGRGIEIPGVYHHIPLDAPSVVAEGLLDFVSVGLKK